MKKILLCFLSLVITLSTVTSVLAADDNVAALIKGDVYLHNSMIITGDIRISEGNIKSDDGGDNTIKGNVYLNENAKNELLPSVHFPGTVIKESTEFSDIINPMSDFPTISNSIDSLTAGWWPLPDPITKDTYFKRLEISNNLVIDTTNGDINIVVDDLIFSGNGYLSVKGNGMVNIYVTKDYRIDYSCQLNKGGKASSVNLFVEGNFTLAGTSITNANVYLYKDNILINGSGKLYGNIISLASKVEITGNSAIAGAVYTPLADVTIANTGKILGKLIANSLDISGRGSITYNACEISIPPYATKYKLVVSANPDNAGDVAPNAKLYNYGDAVQITANAYEGYEFEGFVAPDEVSIDENGYVTVLKDTNIVANFKQISTYGSPVSLTNSGAYIFGKTNSIMAAHSNVTRAEASATLYRLLKQNGSLGDFVYNANAAPIFSDTAGAWYRSAMEYMAHIGIYSKDIGAVKPEADITRGEAFKLFCVALEITDDTSLSYDAYGKILKDSGFVVGFNDDSSDLQLANILTRAQFCSIYNKILGRDTLGLEMVDGTEVNPETYGFTDIANDWAYGVVLRATSAYNDNGLIDISLRNERNQLDDYNS